MRFPFTLAKTRSPSKFHTASGLMPIAEVDLGFARPMDQRHEYLGVPVPPGPHGILDDGVAARVAVLSLQAVEDALGGVTLLAGGVLILLLSKGPIGLLALSSVIWNNSASYILIWLQR